MTSSTRVLLLAAAALAAAQLASAERITLPAAASFQGAAPFYSDVRAFNTSYTADLTVQMIYRCFIGNPCPSVPPSGGFVLGPRESIALDNIVADSFASAGTAGGVEFDYVGSPRQLVVTSRLYSTFPTPTVGMFIPGLEASQAHARTVLTSIRNGGAPQSFRTNVGVFNPGDAALIVAFTIHDADGEPLGLPVLRDVGPHTGIQVSAIFSAAGVPDLSTENAYITAVASSPVFAYAAVIDNATTDPIFVVGARDAPPGTPTITRTPTITFTPSNTFTPSQTFTPSLTFTASRTPTITQTFTPSLTSTITQTPTATRTPIITNLNTRTPTVNPNRIVEVGRDGTNTFFDTVSLSSNTTITVGMTVQWNFVSGYHSTTSGSCLTGCTPNFVWNSGNHNAPFIYTHTFNEVNTYSYYCMQHGAMGMRGAINVIPAGAP